MNSLHVDNRDGVYPVGKDTYRLAHAIASLHPKKYCDVGCGTGFLAIYLAQQGAQCTAADISADAVALTKENARRNKVKLSVVQSDLLSNVRGQFDVISFSTPISTASKKLSWRIALYKKIPFLMALASHFGYYKKKHEREKLILSFIEQAKKHSHKNTSLVLMLHRDELKLFPQHTILKKHHFFRIVQVKNA